MNAPDRLDPRRHAFRPDLADRRLAGRVAALRFVEGEQKRIAARTPLRWEPRVDAAIETEALHGEIARVFEITESGWAWVQLERDGYVGWIGAVALRRMEPAPTHRVTALRTFIYPGPDMKFPPLGWLSLMSEVALGRAVETRDTAFRLLAEGTGAVVSRHVAPLDAPYEPDFVAMAERFLGVPYLWGGRSSLGLDCSALVQLSLMAAGRDAPRDTDMQEAELGMPVEGGAEAALKRGDLVFWQGHVGIMLDEARLIHANGFAMEVTVEPLKAAIARIARAHGPVTSVRRLA